jgi:hypothetical protein
MRLSIRIVGVATSVFWIFLIIFSVSAIYFIKDTQFELGEPQIYVTYDNELMFSIPIKIVNKGYYNLGYFNISTEIFDQEGSEITTGFTFIPLIGKGEVVNATHSMRLNLTDLLQTHQGLLFNDSELLVNQTVSMRAAEVIPIQASSNLSVPWGAPLYNFTLGKPELAAYVQPSSTVSSRVFVPMSFENHASFDVTGTVQVRMYNSTNALTGEGQIAVEAQQHSLYQGKLELVPTKGATRRGHFEVFFLTPLFSYGPLVIPYDG